MLDLNYPAPPIPGPAPPGGRQKDPAQDWDHGKAPLGIRIFDLVWDHPLLLLFGWLALVGTASWICNRPDWMEKLFLWPLLWFYLFTGIMFVLQIVFGRVDRGHR